MFILYVCAQCLDVAKYVNYGSCRFQRVQVCRSNCFLPYGTCDSTLAMAAVRTWWLVNTQWNQCDLQGFPQRPEGSPEEQRVSWELQEVVRRV